MKKIIFLLLLVFVIIVGCSSSNYVEIDNKKIIIEVARTPSEQQAGLMFRESLCDNCGMLFIFDQERQVSFWMKNTIIPLDMIFIDSELKIVDVLHATPCVQDPCASYAPTKNVLYVLETNVNIFNEDIIGEQVKIVLR